MCLCGCKQGGVGDGRARQARVGRRERGANENRSSSGDAAAAIEPEPRALTADVFAITLGGARDLEGSDAEKKRRIVGAFAASYGVEQTRRRARLLPGVVAADWPRDEKFADYALRDVRRRLDGEEGKLRELPWIDHFTVRDEATGGLVRDEHWPENFDHHVGCLFAHMFAWQLARDARSRAALVLERRQLPMPFVPVIRDEFDASNFDQYSDDDGAKQWEKYNTSKSEELFVKEFTDKD